MPRVTVRLPGLLARLNDGERDATVRADTVAGSLDRLVAVEPALEPHLFDDRGALRPHLQVFVNDRSVEWSDAPTTALDHGATVRVIQAVSGG